MRTIAAVLLAAAFVSVGGAALADTIDGDWCGPNDRHLSIRGPFIITPGGSSLSGSYARHSFTYVVPPAEPQAGETVFMRLLNEQTMNFWVGQAGVTAMETWQRCTPISSLTATQPPAA